MKLQELLSLLLVVLLLFSGCAVVEYRDSNGDVVGSATFYGIGSAKSPNGFEIENKGMPIPDILPTGGI